jgi:hypothetical protein
MEYIIGASVMWIVLAGLFTWYQTASSRKAENALEVIIALPLVVTAWTFAIFSFPFALFWKFIRNAVKGVREDVWQKFNFKHFARIGNICFVYDEKAKLWQNKLFMVRIIPNGNTKVVRDIEVICDDTPSSPEGEFRFGEE